MMARNGSRLSGEIMLSFFGQRRMISGGVA